MSFAVLLHFYVFVPDFLALGLAGAVMRFVRAFSANNFHLSFERQKGVDFDGGTFWRGRS